MDLNYLFHRHQVSLMQADAALSVEARVAYDGLARGYARRIVTVQAAAGADRPMQVA